VLGLTLSDGQLRAVQVARSKATIKVVNSVSAALSLDLLDEKPELIGREIRIISTPPEFTNTPVWLRCRRTGS